MEILFYNSMANFGFEETNGVFYSLDRLKGNYFSILLPVVPYP